MNDKLAKRLQKSVFSLSETVCVAWAKSPYDRYGIADESDSEPKWLPLFYHCADSAGVGRMLTQKWLAPRQKEMLARGIGYRCANECEAEIVALVSFVCAVHDLGKLTPAFAIQVDDLALRMEDYGFTFSGMTAESRKQLPHALAGEVIFKKLVQDMGWSKGAAKSLASVIGAHHGIPPTIKDVSDASFRAHELGQDQWEAAREELLS